MITHTLTGPLEQTRGVIGREPAPGEVYRFEFDNVAPRLMHMVGVRQPLDVQWYVDGKLIAQELLRPWFGWARYRADVVEETVPKQPK